MAPRQHGTDSVKGGREDPTIEAGEEGNVSEVSIHGAARTYDVHYSDVEGDEEEQRSDVAIELDDKEEKTGQEDSNPSPPFDPKTFFTQLGTLVAVSGVTMEMTTKVIGYISDQNFQAVLINGLVLGLIQIPTLCALLYVLLKDKVKLLIKTAILISKMFVKKKKAQAESGVKMVVGKSDPRNLVSHLRGRKRGSQGSEPVVVKDDDIADSVRGSDDDFSIQIHQDNNYSPVSRDDVNVIKASHGTKTAARFGRRKDYNYDDSVSNSDSDQTITSENLGVQHKYLDQGINRTSSNRHNSSSLHRGIDNLNTDDQFRSDPMNPYHHDVMSDTMSQTSGESYQSFRETPRPSARESRRDVYDSHKREGVGSRGQLIIPDNREFEVVSVSDRSRTINGRSSKHQHLNHSRSAKNEQHESHKHHHAADVENDDVTDSRVRGTSSSRAVSVTPRKPQELENRDHGNIDNGRHRSQRNQTVIDDVRNLRSQNDEDNRFKDLTVESSGSSPKHASNTDGQRANRARNPNERINSSITSHRETRENKPPDSKPPRSQSKDLKKQKSNLGCIPWRKNKKENNSQAKSINGRNDDGQRLGEDNSAFVNDDEKLHHEHPGGDRDDRDLIGIQSSLIEDDERRYNNGMKTDPERTGASIPRDLQKSSNKGSSGRVSSPRGEEDDVIVSFPSSSKSNSREQQRHKNITNTNPDTTTTTTTSTTKRQPSPFSSSSKSRRRDDDPAAASSHGGHRSTSRVRQQVVNHDRVNERERDKTDHDGPSVARLSSSSSKPTRNIQKDSTSNHTTSNHTTSNHTTSNHTTSNHTTSNHNPNPRSSSSSSKKKTTPALETASSKHYSSNGRSSSSRHSASNQNSLELESDEEKILLMIRQITQGKAQKKDPVGLRDDPPPPTPSSPPPPSRQERGGQQQYHYTTHVAEMDDARAVPDRRSHTVRGSSSSHGVVNDIDDRDRRKQGRRKK